jgi:inhibitor of KinA sporulation pathway (predicted exonuclease)
MSYKQQKINKILKNDYKYFCIIDFEATCWENNYDNKPNEIIEFPSVIYELTEDNNLKYMSQWRKYCKPIVNPILSDFCTGLTGISQNIVDESNIFAANMRKHYFWIIDQIGNDNLDKLIFVTCGSWDFEYALYNEIIRWLNNNDLLLEHPNIYSFIANIPTIYKRYINVKNLYEMKFNKKNSMLGIVEELNIECEGRHHSGLDDSINIGKIFVEVFNIELYKSTIRIMNWNFKSLPEYKRKDI